MSLSIRLTKALGGLKTTGSYFKLFKRWFELTVVFLMRPRISNSPQERSSVRWSVHRSVRNGFVKIAE